MSEGPNIARVASLIGDKARAKMLSSLVQGRALTASELAMVAGVTPATASSHLSKLEAGGLLSQRKNGRHRYFSLSSAEVENALGVLRTLAEGCGHVGLLANTSEPAMREARICYNHLAGERGIQMYESMLNRGFLKDDPTPELTETGLNYVTQLGIDIQDLYRGRAPLCRLCLDWSERKVHLAGALGRALLTVILDRGWALRSTDGSRAITFSAAGARTFDQEFPTVPAKIRQAAE